VAKISVIIPTYNRCDKLKTSIKSVLAQTYMDFELLIVDDGSTDDTQVMVESMQDARIRYIKLQQNMGASAARNEGVQQASSDIIAFHDSDDIWRPQKLEKQMAYWQEHPEFSMIYSPYLWHGEESVIRMPYEGQEGLEGDIFPWLFLRNTVGTPTMLMRKACFQEAGGFDVSLRCLEDWEFVLRFAKLFLVGFVDEVLVDAYYSGGGVSTAAGAHFETRCRMIVENREYLVQNDLFDMVVKELLKSAERVGMLEEVKRLLMILLQA